jgi:hypothetical protein
MYLIELSVAILEMVQKIIIVTILIILPVLLPFIFLFHDINILALTDQNQLKIYNKAPLLIVNPANRLLIKRNFDRVVRSSADIHHWHTPLVKHGG